MYTVNTCSLFISRKFVIDIWHRGVYYSSEVLKMKSEDTQVHTCSICQSEVMAEQGKRKSHHDDKTIKELVTRMNRIEGQIRGIKGMIERHVYCDDILNQISSAQAALDGASRLLLEKHMKSCVKERLQSEDDQVVDEVLKTIFRMIR